MNRPAILSDARERLLAMLSETSRHVDILSPQLEPLLLDDDEVMTALVRLARRGHNTRIRVLLAELRPVLESGHRLLALGRRLSTAVTVRVLSEHSEWNGETAAICDRREGLLLNLSEHRFRPLDTAPDGMREAERFDRLWLAGETSPELRQL